MWGRNRKKEVGSLLSLSSLGAAAHNSSGKHAHALDSSWATPGAAGSPRWPGRLSAGQAGSGARSVTCSIRDDGLGEVVAQHEQLINNLGEKLATLEDAFERLQQDVVPALKLAGAVRQTQQAGGAAAVSDAAALAKDQDPDAAEAGPDAGLQCEQQQQQQAVDALQQAVGRALADLASDAAGAAAQDRDDYGSVRSFCTSVSCASTQLSGPALLTDLKPAAKAPSRAPTQHLQQQQASGQLSWGSSMRHQEYAAAGVASWPLELGVHEECSPEEIQQMVQLIVEHEPMAGDRSSEQQQQEQLDVQRQTISWLALHAEGDEEVRQQICTPALLSRITAMLGSSDLACCQAAVHLVWYFSRSACLRPILQQQEQLLPALLSLLGSPDAASARAAAFALNNQALDAKCRHEIVEGGAVAGLIDMLAGCDSLGQEAAAAALQMLASEEGNIRALIVACNGVSALVEVLQYGGPAAQEAAAAALENLSLDEACEAALAGDGAVDALLQVLKDGTTGAQAAAAGALRNLAVNEQLEGQLLAAGMVPVLLGLVADGRLDVGVRTAALEGLRNLAASSTKSGDVLVQAGGAAVLVDAARGISSATARSAALAGLLVLSCDEAHRRAIVAAGSAGVLVHAALSGSLQAKEYAARALANLATSEATALQLIKEGAATVLTSLLRCQAAGLVAAAAAAKGAKQQPVAGTASVGCCVAAARAVQNLAKCRDASRPLLEAGCVAALVAALIFPGPIATSAISSLRSLCTSSRALRELVSADGVTRLVQAVAKPKHLTARGQKQGLRLLRRLVSATNCKAAVQEQVAAMGIVLG